MDCNMREGSCLELQRGQVIIKNKENINIIKKEVRDFEKTTKSQISEQKRILYRLQDILGTWRKVFTWNIAYRSFDNKRK